MESTKITKLSLESFHQESQSDSSASFASWSGSQRNEFSLSKSFWDSILSDPISRAEVDSLVEIKALERVEEKLSSLREEARAEGVKKGIEEGKQTFAEKMIQLENKVTLICESILNEKHKLLAEHEEDWCQALAHCLKRFLVPNVDQKLSLTREWMEESLRGFPQTARVILYLNPADFNAVQSDLLSFKGERWEFRSDAKLSQGVIRAECEGGGVLFDSKEQLDKLDVILKREVQAP